MNNRFRLGTREVQYAKDLQAVIQPGGADEVVLRYRDLEVWIWASGDYGIHFDSKAIAREYMEKDEKLTAEVQKHFRDYARRTTLEYRPGTHRYIESWVQPHPYVSWGKPDSYPSGKRDWQIGLYGSDNTFNLTEDCWIGDVFDYTHFVTSHDDGLVVRWHEGGDARVNYSEPEIWIGSVDEFMTTQNDCEWYTAEGFLRWNESFQNGFIWAINELGGFDRDTPLDHRVYEAIRSDPTIVKGEIANKIMKNERGFPPEVVQAVKGMYARA